MGTCRTVLIVEDEPEIRESLKELLELEGYVVLAAENGRVALDLLKSAERPCLILLDLLMPVMTGQEVLAAMRKDDILATIPVVIVSGVAERPPGTESLPFVKKPIQFDSFLKEVTRICGSAVLGPNAAGEAA